ncbi:DUF3052 family protein [Spirosoma sp. BT702]|uniref:DUF3052 family protein n=2 Tax=Spirosoma profusum TaxID=2771354 RepID=A0A926XWI2_9BACT|nr:DUF3052 family protein [Spirosoma profusum]
MGIKAEARAFFMNAPEEALKVIELPVLDRQSTLEGTFDYIHFFVTYQQEMHEQFATLKNHLKATGTLWVSWPKGGKNGTDLTLTKVIEIGYEYGLVESKTLSINEMWSAIKFTHPKEGKIYKNSYGKLKQ